MVDLIVKTFIKNYEQTEDINVREKFGKLSGIITIICNLFLFGFKLLAGIVSGSISITADALNNLSDMGSSIIVLCGFHLAAKPADPDHPYGHGRIEYVSAFIVSGLILLVGVELFKSSVTKILHPEAITFTIISIIILAASIIAKLLLYLFNNALAKKISSKALKATAQDSLNDALTTLAILVSVIVMMVANINIDAYIGLLMSVFILYSGVKTAKETLDPLLGEPLDKETALAIEKEIMTFDTFLGIHDLVPHNYGPGRCFASVHVEVPANTDIVKCHEQVDLCEKIVAEKLGIVLTIHMDPVETDNEKLNEAKEKMLSELIKIDPRLNLHDFRMTPKTEKQTNLIFDVVLPLDFTLTRKELKEKIGEIARSIDPTYVCVVEFDLDYTENN